ncbi:hypothetical protein C8Q80DRAFT_426579 [Daedaleopsis nitida]|nr:hypothetical protein C8Q80DRAFT_426579 [Daedaleopsis nitida]
MPAATSRSGCGWHARHNYAGLRIPSTWTVAIPRSSSIHHDTHIQHASSCGGSSVTLPHTTTAGRVLPFTSVSYLRVVQDTCRTRRTAPREDPRFLSTPRAFRHCSGRVHDARCHGRTCRLSSFYSNWPPASPGSAGHCGRRDKLVGSLASMLCSTASQTAANCARGLTIPLRTPFAPFTAIPFASSWSLTLQSFAQRPHDPYPQLLLSHWHAKSKQNISEWHLNGSYLLLQNTDEPDYSLSATNPHSTLPFTRAS